MNNPQILEIIENLKGRRAYEEKRASKLGLVHCMPISRIKF